ncbi:hypothetical protein AB0P21_13920 [Kribbella sp. NPDC056861]|uniref:hypothetical protein n=1 Tax=Kribbella sp. NPDC056861 TaxID=3154857 RepID=UPI003439552D
MSARVSTLVAGVAMVGLVLVACGNDTKPAGNGAPSAGTSSLPAKPAPTRTGQPVNTPPKPSTGPTGPQTPGAPTTSPTKPPKLTTALLLTGPELSKADPNRGWAATGGTASTPICGRASTRGDNPLGSLNRNFVSDLDASGGQWITRYADAKAARAAYDQILKTIKSCRSALPAPTHARKLTENRGLPLGNATQLLRWYDYPLPSDPGSEDGGFPYAVTVKDKIVSVLAFGEMGKGIKPANFERITRAAAAHLN